MRRRDLYLSEAIDASGIDRKARVLLQDRLMKHIEKEWVDFQRHFPEGDTHDRYDAFYQHWNSEEPVGGPGTISHEWAFTRRIADVASRCLTELVRQHLVEKFGDREKQTVKVHNRLSVPASVFSVKVEDRSDSADAKKDSAGGYFRTDISQPIIKVFVNRNDIWEAGMGVAQVVAMGEGEGFDTLTNVIAPTFVHEYVHMEQFVRGDFGEGDTDWGYITTALPDGSGGGRRGNRRSPGVSLVHWLRYRGSAAEIEAFAQQCASEMMKEASRYHRTYDNSQDISDDAISAVLQDLATGYASASAMRAYNAIGWGEYSEECAKFGVKPHEMKITWKRFMKLTYRAVHNYRQERFGRTKLSNWHIKKAPELWRNAVERGFTVSKTAQTIAYDLVQKMLDDTMSGIYDGEKMVRHNQQVFDAAMFLHAAYYGKDEYDDSKYEAVSAAFRRLVIRMFDQSKEKLRKAA